MKLLKYALCVWLAVALCVGQCASSVVAMSKPHLKVTSAIVIDGNNGQILYEKAPNKLLEVGMLSQWLSIYVIYQAVESGQIALNSVVPISDKAYSLSQDYDIANVPLRQDFEYTVEELLEVVAMTGAHGALMALAEYVASTQEQFMTKMTAQLTEWGIKDYEIINVTGLPQDYQPNDTQEMTGKQNQLTAVGLATIAHHLTVKYPQYALLANRDKKQFKSNTDDPFEMMNRNPMFESNLYGHKAIQSGLANESVTDGNSYMGSALDNDMRVVSIVLASPSDVQAYADTKKLLDYVQSSYRSQRIIEKNESVTQVGQVKVANSTQQEAQLVYGDDVTLTVPIIDTTPRYEYVFVPEEAYFNPRAELVAPLDASTLIGHVTVQVRGKDIYFLESSAGNRVPILLKESLAKAPWYATFWQLAQQTMSSTWESVRKFFTELFN